jgi:hypothetical protein
MGVIMNERKITATEGMVFRRMHDQTIMGDTIYLGYDYSTGVKRLDLPEYYEQVPEPETETPGVEEPH